MKLAKAAINTPTNKTKIFLFFINIQTKYLQCKHIYILTIKQIYVYIYNRLTYTSIKPYRILIGNLLPTFANNLSDSSKTSSASLTWHHPLAKDKELACQCYSASGQVYCGRCRCCPPYRFPCYDLPKQTNRFLFHPNAHNNGAATSDQAQEQTFRLCPTPL